RIEDVLGIDPGDRFRRLRGAGGDSAGECRTAGTTRAGELRHPSPGQTASEHPVERGQTGGEPWYRGSGSTEADRPGPPQSIQQGGSSVRHGSCFVFSSPTCQWGRFCRTRTVIVRKPHTVTSDRSEGGGAPRRLPDGAPQRGRVHRWKRRRRDGVGGEPLGGRTAPSDEKDELR